MFKGFQKSGQFRTTVALNQMFQGFSPIVSPTNNTIISGIPANNLVAWFRPDVNITLDGSGNVSQWQDTTATYTLLQGTAANRPGYKYLSGNGRPYLDFSAGSSISLSANGSSFLNIGTNTQLQIISVFQIGGSAAVNCLVSDGATGSTSGSYLLVPNTSASGIAFKYEDSTSLKSVNITNVVLGQTYIMSGEVDRSAGKIYGSLNNSWRNVNTATNVESTNFTPNNWKISGSASTQPILMDILVYIGGNLSQSDYLMLRNYMGQLYNF